MAACKSALSARSGKTRRYTNVVCCSLKILPWSPATARCGGAPGLPTAPFQLGICTGPFPSWGHSLSSAERDGVNRSTCTEFWFQCILPGQHTQKLITLTLWRPRHTVSTPCTPPELCFALLLSDVLPSLCSHPTVLIHALPLLRLCPAGATSPFSDLFSWSCAGGKAVIRRIAVMDATQSAPASNY